MEFKTINDLKIGDKGSFSKTIAESDVYTFAGITGDLNPAHINEAYAEKTYFGKRIAHGIFLLGLVSGALGSSGVPGPGSIYLKQTCEFLNPVFIGDTITACVEVVKLDIEKNKVTLRTYCLNQDDKLILDGEAIISPSKKKTL